MHSIVAVLYLQFELHVMLFRPLNVLYFYISSYYYYHLSGGQNGPDRENTVPTKASRIAFLITSGTKAETGQISTELSRVLWPVDQAGYDGPASESWTWQAWE